MKQKTGLQTTFTTFLQQQNLEGTKLLLMVSGGVDSVVLLHVAVQVVEPENLAVFHLNHNTREDSKDDETFVQNLCTKLNIKFYSSVLGPPEKGDLGGLKSKTKNPSQPPFNKGGAESAWRKQRQNLSQKAADDFGATRILTAHHATDLVETMIFRLTKGCGPAGLSPFDTSTKPFWQLPKQALLDYAAEHKLEWREDESNLNTKFERNLIRHKVLPSLRKITPNLEQVFVREAQTFDQVSEFLKAAVSSLAARGELEGGWLTEALEKKSVSLEHFLALPPILQTELLRHIAVKTPSQSELEDCLKWLLGKPEGNSEKNIGGTKLEIKAGCIVW